MQTVIVTGGSRGLGLGICRALAADGYRVIAVARTEHAGLTAAISEAAATGNGAIEFSACDLADVSTLPALVRDLRKRCGPIHGLVNNAGLGTSGSLAMMPAGQIEQLIRLNTLSPILLTKHVVRHMLADGGGRIVNVSSIVGFTGYLGLSVYSATKASMLGFTRSLAREVGRMGITVNAVAPGFLDTDMTHDLQGDQREQVVRRSALRRLPEVSDVAHAVAYLLGPHARNITGTTVTIDAGSTA